MPSHYMSKEEKQRMFMRVVELREKYGLKFKHIGERMGVSEAHAHAIYARMKKKERGK